MDNIPASWRITNLGHVVSFKNGRDYKDVESDVDNVPIYGSGGIFAQATTYLHDGESILFGRKGTVDRPLYVTGKFWTVDTMYYTVPGPLVVPKYVYYWATTVDYSLIATQTAVPSTTSGDLGRQRIPLPPLKTQRAIADYLDRETSEIDAMLNKIEGMNQLLNQRREAAVMEILFGQENTLKFLTVPFWSLIDFITEKTEPRDFKVALEDIESGTGKLISNEPANYDKDGILFRKNDILFGKLRPYLAKFFQPSSCGTAGGDIHVYRPLSHVNPRFLFYVISSRKFITYASNSTTGVKMPRTEWSSLRNFPTPLPPIDQQTRIATRLDKTLGHIDAMLTKTKELKNLLIERRSALITAAVTGQIEVT